MWEDSIIYPSRDITIFSHGDVTICYHDYGVSCTLVVGTAIYTLGVGASFCTLGVDLLVAAVVDNTSTSFSLFGHPYGVGDRVGSL